MKGIHIGCALLALVLWAPLADAAIDCEPARCAVQAAIDAQCPCEAASNHGRHVSCVARVVRNLAKDGTVPTQCKGKITRCAARSTCGKDAFVTCQVPVVGTCDLGTGTCVGNPSLTCLGDADCVIGSKCRTQSSAERCLARGGTPGAGTSCCASCVTPLP
jgi:hypothetical protein